MELFLNGIQNFLLMVNNNWATIVVVIGLGLMVYKKVKDFVFMSTDEKIEAAKSQLSSVILSLVQSAEIQYKDYSSAGEIKRSQVIDEIFTKYPILNKVTDQESLLAYIDQLIDEALETVRQTVRTENVEKAKVTEAAVAAVVEAAEEKQDD